MGNNQSVQKISAQDRAILDMKNQRDKLRQYQKRIVVITDREKSIAKECLARGDKDKALLALRRKKYQESLLAKTDSQLEQLEKLTSSVEFAIVQKDVLYGLKQGTQVLHQIHKEMGGLEAVEKLMGESEEARAYQQFKWMVVAKQLARGSLTSHELEQEISDALSGQMSNEDEDEVEDELERMEKEALALPEVPSQPLANKAPQNVPTPIFSDDTERLQRQKERARARKVALHA